MTSVQPLSTATLDSNRPPSPVLSPPRRRYTETADGDNAYAYPLPTTPPESFPQLEDSSQPRRTVYSPPGPWSGRRRRLSMPKRETDEVGEDVIGFCLGKDHQPFSAIRSTRRTSSYVYSCGATTSQPTSAGTSASTSTTTLYTTTSSLLSFSYADSAASEQSLQSYDRPHVLNADSDSEDGDETERAAGTDEGYRQQPTLDSDLDDEIILCEVPPRAMTPVQRSRALQSSHLSMTPTNVHKRKFPQTSYERQQRTFHNSQSSAPVIYHQSDAEVTLPQALRRLIPWVRAAFFGWVLVMTFVLISFCVFVGLFKAVWDAWTDWRSKRRQRVSHASPSKVNSD